jgi:hypothetical protein
MNEPNDQIQRLGFEAWADNIIVNVVENITSRPAGPYEFSSEEEDVTVLVRLRDGEINATIRAYIPGKGWHYHDRVIKVGVQK